MTGDLHAETRLVRQRFARFAAAHIAGRGDLDNGEAFPRDLWRRMGEAGLFRPGIPKRYGGSGGLPDLAVAGEALSPRETWGPSWPFSRPSPAFRPRLR